MTATRIYVPRETAAVSVGADDVAVAIARQAKESGDRVQLIRNGSWGATWLEPLVEVEVNGKRIAYGNVAATDVPGLFAAGLLSGGEHEKRIGPTDEIPYLVNQDRWTFRRCGLIEPLSIDDYRAHRGFAALEKAFEDGPAAVLEAVRDSGLRGRGGAGFPTGIKWQTVADTEADQKYITCNADEGDSGTFSDRILMESDPFGLLEGMTIAGFAVGASRGYIYLRSEYPLTHKILSKALDSARDAGWLGSDIRGSGFDFDIELHLGAGSYVCGEETAMLESLEGKPGIVRYKPPLPAIAGLFEKPTVVNNVVTLASVPDIVNRGADQYAAYGVNRSKGTLAFQLAGNIKRGGLVEKAFGLTLRELVEDWGGLPMVVCHGGIVVFDDTADMAQQARFAMEFCAIESCGKCTPCRIGSTRGVEVIDRMVAGIDRDDNYDLLIELCDTMEDASLCAMGGMTPYPVRSVLKYFSEDFAPSTGVKQ